MHEKRTYEQLLKGDMSLDAGNRVRIDPRTKKFVNAVNYMGRRHQIMVHGKPFQESTRLNTPLS